MAKNRKYAGAAIVGGALGTGAMLALFLATYVSRIETMAQAEAEKAAKDFLGRNYGLTPERIAKLEAYGTILG